ncbi:TonB-dependent siderophore receptor [Massilia sp. Root418]|uniref:TonB-dependent receptor plug domain-containing protein n=1 Tax=Massilia sp. Root418 TaxID=1736532 RepID=UPI001E2EE98F|nr:TonB-dependent receptor [Massilia sp. Root418]
MNFSLAAAAVASALNSWAAPVPLKENRDEKTSIQKVEVNGSAADYDARRDDTASKIVVGAEEILRYGDSNIAEVLKRLPGVTVSTGRGGSTDIRLRGLGAGYTQILLNGERAPAGFSFDQLSPDAIERVEIMRAASAEFSAQAIAGTINIVLKKAVRTAQRELKATAGRGNDFSQGNGIFTLSDKDGNFSYSAVLTLNRLNFHWLKLIEDNGTDARGQANLLRESESNEVGRLENLNLAPRLNWTLPNGDTLTSQNFIASNRYRVVATVDSRTVFGAPQDFDGTANDVQIRNDFYRSDLNWMHKLAGGGKLDTKLGLNANRNSNAMRQTGALRGVPGLDRQVDSLSRERGYTFTGKYSTPLVPGHALSMGWDGADSRRDDTRVQREAPLPGARPANMDEDFAADVRRLALYAQDEWDFTPRLSIYAGLRWEGLETGSHGSGFEPISSRSSVFSPVLQTLWKIPDTKDQLRAALTRTYKAPATTALIPRRTLAANNTQNTPDFRGNPALKPELALGLDLSYEHYWAGTALLSASGFVRKISDYTRQELLLENGRWVQTSVNDGSAVARGVELEAKFPLKAVMETAQAVDLRASVSRNWSRVDAVPGPYNQLNQQVPLQATLGVDYKSADGVVTAGGSFIFKRGGVSRISTEQSSFVTAKRDLDVYFLYKFTPRHALRLSIVSALAEDWLEEYTYADPRGSLRRNSLAPGAAQFRAGLEWKL